MAAAALSPHFLAAGWAYDSSQSKESSFPACVQVELRKEGLSHYSGSLRKGGSLDNDKWPHTALCRMKPLHRDESRASPSGAPI